MDIVVKFMWSSMTSLSNDGVRNFNESYTLTLTDTTDWTSITIHTSNMSLNLILQFNKTYTITLYASLCNHTLTSNPFITNITIDRGKDL